MANNSAPNSAPAEPEPPRDEDEHQAACGAAVALLEQRARLLLSLALLFLPAFALTHALLLPQARYALAATHGALLLLCSLARELAPRMKRLQTLRGLLFATYTLLFAGGAAVCAQIAWLGAEASLMSHMAVLSFLLLLTLSTLSLPLSARDTAALALGALPSVILAACSAPQSVGLLYLFGLVVSSASVSRQAHINAARTAQSPKLGSSKDDEPAPSCT